MYYALPVIYEKLLFCSSGFAVYSSEERQLGFGAGYGFFHCFQKTENYAYVNFQRSYSDQPVEAHKKGHHQRSL